MGLSMWPSYFPKCQTITTTSLSMFFNLLKLFIFIGKLICLGCHKTPTPSKRQIKLYIYQAQQIAINASQFNDNVNDNMLVWHLQAHKHISHHIFPINLKHHLFVFVAQKRTKLVCNDSICVILMITSDITRYMEITMHLR